jgi:hypothetical protein
VDVLKDGFGDQVVAPCGQPPAALIPPSQVKAKGDAWEIAYDSVIQLEPAL